MHSKADYGNEAIGVAWSHVGWTFARSIPSFSASGLFQPRGMML